MAVDCERYRVVRRQGFVFVTPFLRVPCLVSQQNFRVKGNKMNTNKAIAKVLEKAVVDAADEFITDKIQDLLDPVAREQQRLAEEVYTLRRFRKHLRENPASE